MDLDAFRWLLTDDGQALLARAEALDPADPLRAQTALRRHAGAEHVAAALTQAELRRRADAKFGDRRRPDVLHPRRSRAGHPRSGRPAPRGPAARPSTRRSRRSTSAAASAAT